MQQSIHGLHFDEVATKTMIKSRADKVLETKMLRTTGRWGRRSTSSSRCRKAYHTPDLLSPSQRALRTSLLPNPASPRANPTYWHRSSVPSKSCLSFMTSSPTHIAICFKEWRGKTRSKGAQEGSERLFATRHRIGSSVR